MKLKETNGPATAGEDGGDRLTQELDRLRVRDAAKGGSPAPPQGPPGDLPAGDSTTDAGDDLQFSLGLLGQQGEQEAAAFLLERDDDAAKLTEQELGRAREIFGTNGIDIAKLAASPVGLEACRRIGRLNDVAFALSDRGTYDEVKAS